MPNTRPHTPVWTRRWRTDFSALEKAAVADAEGKSTPEERRLLRSPEWCDAWHDALECAASELATAVERMIFTNDQRAIATRATLVAVRTALTEARRLIKHRTKQEGRVTFEKQHYFQADEVALRWLRHHHTTEADARCGTLLAAAGLPPWPPRPPRAHDSVDGIERAWSAGLLDDPRTAAVDDLLAMDDETFRNAVADDVRHQNRRLAALRHPLLLNDWMAALQDLADMTAPRAGLDERNLQLAPVDFDALWAMTSENARCVLNARRFYRGVEQRMVEWRKVVRRRAREAARAEEEAKRPWEQVQREVRQDLAERHPRQYEALRRALDPFGVRPGSVELDRRRFTEEARRELKRMMLAALADGTWKNLLS